MSILERTFADLGGPHRALHGAVLRGVLLAAAGANCVWLVRFAVPTGLAWWTTLSSELEATGHPWAPVFQGGFLLADGLTLVAGALAAATWAQARAHPVGMAGWAALAAFGAASLVDDAVPLNCVPGHDPHCQHRSGGVFIWPVIDQIHAMTSVLAALAALASMAAFARLARSRPRAGELRWSWAWLAAELASTTALGACLFADAPAGLAQTAEFVVETTWLVFLARSLPLPGPQDL